ncbi:reverse transcriptase, partial [Teladorsagia circumcincta]
VAEALAQSSDPGDPGNEHDALRARGRRNLWHACELEKLSRLVLEHRRGSRIDWPPLAAAWDSTRNPGDAKRTVSALKSMHAKCRKREQERAGASVPLGPVLTEELQGSSSQEGSHPDVGPPEPPEVITVDPVVPSLEEKLVQRFDIYYKIAISSYDRRPVRRPEGVIPKDLLVAGNTVLLRKLENLPATNGRQCISSLNAAVYAIAKAIAATADELRRERIPDDPKRRLRELYEKRRSLLSIVSTLSGEICRRKALRQRKEGAMPRPSKSYLRVAAEFKIRRRGELGRVVRMSKDQLNVTQLEIRKLEEARRRMLVRRKGVPFVVHERECPSDTPVASVREYWHPIVGQSRPFEVSPELEEWSRTLGSPMCDTPLRSGELTEDAWKSLFAKVRPWKATGPDGIQAFWWKHLPEARLRLTSWCLRALRQPKKSIPNWLCQGRVVLIPKKKGDPSSLGPGDFRPIACLNTCYKILTGMMAEHISKTVGDRFPGSQVALRKGVWGCTHAQILDQTIVRDAERHRNELHMLWVDMTKAYDSLRHGAIKWTVKRWGVPSDVRRLLSTLMSLQTVRYCGYASGRQVKSRPLQIRNGLMQGDTLSPLLFCLTIAPLSAWIQANIKPYQTKTGSGPRSDGALSVNHVFYMDDLKVWTTDWENLMLARKGIQRVAGQLGLKMNMSKCAIRSLNSADMGQQHADEVGSIPILGGTEVYKYLGAEQTGLVCFEELWSRVAESATVTARRLFFSNLTVRQKVNGFNQVVVPKLKYAFSCIVFGAGRFKTLRVRARKFDLEMRRLLVESHTRFKHSCCARLYVGKESGGLGMKLVEEELELSVTYTWAYLATNTDFLVSFELSERLRASTKRSITSDFQAVMAANGLDGRVTRTVMATIKVDNQTFYTATNAARAVSKLIRERWAKVHLNDWRSKGTAGRVLREHLQDGNPTGLCMKDSFLWSVNGQVSSEVLRNVWGAQEASLLTRSSACGRALALAGDGLCRMRCGPFAETAEHVVSACGYWRTSLMVERHDEVARVLYSSIRRKYNITEVVNSHRPHVVETRDVVIHWNDSIVTSEGLKHNRPDLLVWDRRAQRIWIIEISISWFTRVLAQEQRKLGKYGVNSTLPEETGPDGFHPGPNLRAVLQKDRKCRVDVVPIVLGACGEVTPNLRRYIRSLELRDNASDLIERMQRCAILGTNRLVKCHLANNAE